MVVAAQLSDAAGNTVVERSGLTVALRLVSSGGDETSASCAVAATSGLTTCRCTVPSGWFSTAAESSATATVQLRYSNALRVEASAGSVTLQRAPAHDALKVATAYAIERCRGRCALVARPGP